jgi:hypothetical protein
VYRPDVPARFERVLEKAMSLLPADRFADMGALVAAFAAGETQTGASEIAAVPPRVKSRRRSIALAVGISAAAGLALYAAARWL